MALFERSKWIKFGKLSSPFISVILLSKDINDFELIPGQDMTEEQKEIITAVGLEFKEYENINVLWDSISV